MGYAIYTRISRDRSGEEAGVTRQETECKALAEARGLTVDEVYSDNDTSAFSGVPRPAYERMLKALDEGKHQGIITWKSDRLYRRLADLSQLTEVVNNAKAEIHTVKSGTIDLSTAMGRATANIYAAIAQNEVESGIERQTLSQKHRAKEGKFRGGTIPYGYHLGDKPGTLEIFEPEAKIVREIAQRIIAGQTLLSIATSLNRREIPTQKNGRKWYTGSVRQVVRKESVAGLSIYHGEVVGKAQWEPIVNPDDWYIVRSILDDPKRRTQAGIEKKWQGSGVYFCGECGGKMICKIQSSKKYAYMCRECQKVSRSQINVDELVDSVILGYLSLPENRLKVVDRSTVSGDDVGELVERRALMVERRDRLGALFAAGSISEGALVAGNDELDKSITDLDARISDMRGASPVVDLVLSEGDLAKRWGEMTATMRGLVIDDLVRVTILKAPRAGRPFRPEFVRIEWK